MAMSDRALVQRQKDVIKMQDEMLVDIEKGVGRLHEKVKITPFFIEKEQQLNMLFGPIN
jgi:hypothetical protein